MNRNYKAHLALLLVTIIFGMHYMIGKSLMPVPFQPMQLLFMRSLGGVLLALPHQGVHELLHQG